MSQNFSEPTRHPKLRSAPWIAPLLGYGVWLLVAYELSNLLIGALVGAIQSTFGPISHYMSISLANSIAGFLLYGVMILLMIWLPAKVLRHPLDSQLLGVDKNPTWVDVALGPVGVIATLIAGAVLTATAMHFFPGFNADQAQDVGVNAIGTTTEMIVAIGLLIIVGPFIEELIFRGYLYGTLLRCKVPDWVAMVAVSGLFGIVHRQWNVGLIVFCLSMAACLARKYTGSIWAGVAMHIIKNGMAFYLLPK